MQRKPSNANHNKAGIRICRSWISQQSVNIFLIFPERSTSCFLFEKRKKITRQWSHVKTFEFVCFYCLTSIFCFFCFCGANFDVSTIFLWAFWHFHGNVYTNGKLNSFSNKIYNYYVKKKKKKVIFQLLTGGHIFPNFPLFWVQIREN